MSRNRGKPKPKLQDLSKMPLTYDEQQALVNSLSRFEHPITTAVLGCAMVEHQLELSIQKRIPRKDEDTWKALTLEIGPLSTFHRKITLALALKVIDEKMSDDLHIVRNIRNAFAHARRLIDFKNELVIKELLDAHSLTAKTKRELRKAEKNEGQVSYAVVCLTLGLKLLKKRTRPKRGKYSNIVKALMLGIKLHHR